MSDPSVRVHGTRGTLTRAISAALGTASAASGRVFTGSSSRLLAASLVAGLTLSAGASAARPADGLEPAASRTSTEKARPQGMLAAVDADAMRKTLPERAANQIQIRLQQAVFDPLLAPASLPANLVINAPRGGADYFLVQFEGPIQAGWRRDLERRGVTIMDYVPDFAYLVKAPSTMAQTLATMPNVRWSGLYQPAFRLSRELIAGLSAADASRTIELNVRLFPGEEDTVLDALQMDRSVAVIDAHTDGTGGRVLRVQAAETRVADLAGVPGIAWIEPRAERALMNEVARSDDAMRKDYVENTLGLYGQNQVVVVGDTGFSTGNPATVHQDVRGRILGGTTASGSSCGGWADGHSHGTHVAGSVLGNGFHSGADVANHDYAGSNAGIAPEATLYMWGFCNDFSGLPEAMYNDYYTVMRNVDARARVNTNSWGYTSGQGNYNIDARDSDRFIADNPDMIILYAAGNEGVDGNGNGVVDPGSTNMPGTAKNVITVGASENFRMSGGYNPGGPCSTWGGCWPSDYPAAPINGDRLSNNLNGMVAFSSRGPVNDGRLKPDVVAPGSNIVSTRNTTGTGWGVFDANYIYNGGTSMATPLVAGAAAIVREYYQTEHGIASPGAALVKATLINGAFDMSPGQYGAGATQDVLRRPDINQGWGRVDLRNSLVYEGGRDLYFHQSPTGLATGQTFQTTLTVAQPSIPLRATLVWVDPPGTEASFGALVNDLDLTVQPPSGPVLNGNDMLDGVADGDVDRTNNTEGVDVTSPQAGEWTFTVTGFNVPDASPQRFALVITGGLPQAPFYLDLQPSSRQICAGTDATYDVGVELALPTFTDPIALSASGNPAGSTATFSVNNQPGPYDSLLTIGNTAAATPGSFSINVTATSGAESESSTVDLQLFGAAPGAFNATLPADGAQDVALLPTLSWTAATEATTYLVEVATDAGFSNIVYSTSVSGTSHTLATPLQSDTAYHWRVTTENACGDTSTAVSDFRTRVAPTILLVDDDNNAPDRRPLYEAAVTTIAGAGSYDIHNTLTQGEPDAATLAAYRQVIWFSGDQFGSGSATNPLAGPTQASEGLLASWLDAGNACLFISSQDYFYDRDEVVSPFMTNYLGVGTMVNDPSSGRYTSVTGENLYTGTSGALTTPADFANWLDFITPNAQTGVQRAFVGNSGTPPGAGVSKLTESYLTTFTPFPIENLPPASTAAILQRFFDTCPITASNEAPVASNDEYTTTEDAPLSIDAAAGVLFNDTDAEDDPLTAELGTDVQHGVLVLDADGSFSYTPTANYCNSDAATTDDFTYRADDGNAQSDEATVSITVTCVNDDPEVATGIANQTSVEGAVINLDIAGNFDDVDGDELSFSTADTLPAGLTLSSAGVISGTIAFTASDDSPYAITITADDGNGGTVDASFTWTVKDTNAAPQTTGLDDDQAVATLAYSRDVSDAFSDTDGDTLQFSATGLPASLTISSAGVISGTPTEAEIGDYTVTVTAGDGTDTVQATFELSVVAIAIFGDGFED